MKLIHTRVFKLYILFNSFDCHRKLAEVIQFVINNVSHYFGSYFSSLAHDDSLQRRVAAQFHEFLVFHAEGVSETFETVEEGFWVDDFDLRAVTTEGLGLLLHDFFHILYLISIHSF